MNKKYIKREYGRNRYRNMSEENKQRLNKYQKNYRVAKSSGQFSIILLDCKYENVMIMNDHSFLIVVCYVLI